MSQNLCLFISVCYLKGRKDMKVGNPGLHRWMLLSRKWETRDGAWLAHPRKHLAFCGIRPHHTDTHLVQAIDQPPEHEIIRAPATAPTPQWLHLKSKEAAEKCGQPPPLHAAAAATCWAAITPPQHAFHPCYCRRKETSLWGALVL